jgi:hypothetical protein
MHRARLVAVAFVAAFAIALPLGAFAAHQFADVPDTNPFHADIDALADSGVTSGCGGGNFCPKDAVTREQMAAFLNRLGALAPGKTPVVNADKLDGIDSTGFVPQAGPIVITGNMDAWIVPNPDAALTIDRSSPATVLFYRSGAALKTLKLSPQVPTIMYGQRLKITGMELCYSASSTARLEEVELFVVSQSTTPIVTPATLFYDPTIRTNTTCQTWTFSSQYVFGPDDGGPVLELGVAWTAAGNFRIGRTTFIFEADTATDE